MIKKLIDSDFRAIDLHFVPMNFSRDMDEIGRFRWSKLLRLPVLIGQVWSARFRTRSATLYYPPGGESVTAIVRDIVVLLSCRVLFKHLIFHAHAGGFTEIVATAPWPIRFLARCAYRKPDLFIQLTDKSPPDGTAISARRIISVPCGLPDDGARFVDRFRAGASPQRMRLLFVGVVSRSKGVMVLLEACARLKAQKIEFHLSVVGRFHSPEFEAECMSFIADQGLGADVEFVGVIVGDDKWDIFCTSDIFCFPSHFESENQPLVVLEAMQFGLPIVASDWRSISTMVESGRTGYIVPVRDSAALAERIALLACNPKMRETMGRAARVAFLESYTDDEWRLKIEMALSDVI